MTNNETETALEKKKYSDSNLIIAAVAIPIAVILIVLMLYLGISIKSDAINDGYKSGLQTGYDSGHQVSYDYFYNKTFEEYRVTNDVSIIIDSVRAEEKLEVLKVSDVEYVIRTKGEGENRYDTWLEVPGIGTFTVNLKAGEFIIDNERKYVLVRVPEPVLTDFTLDYENIQLLQFKGGIFNGSYKEGTDMAQADMKEGYNLVKNELTGNPNFKEYAKESAQNIIQNLVRV